jgi:histone chaperone ASF1
MSRVQIDNISVTNPKAVPSDTIHLALTFSALTQLPHTLTWRLTYVGSAFSEEHDQLLEEFEIGPIPEPSTMSFTVEVDPPDLALVPREELLCKYDLIQPRQPSSCLSVISSRNSPALDITSSIHIAEK